MTTDFILNLLVFKKDLVVITKKMITIAGSLLKVHHIGFSEISRTSNKLRGRGSDVGYKITSNQKGNYNALRH